MPAHDRQGHGGIHVSPSGFAGRAAVSAGDTFMLFFCQILSFTVQVTATCLYLKRYGPFFNEGCPHARPARRTAPHQCPHQGDPCSGTCPTRAHMTVPCPAWSRAGSKPATPPHASANLQPPSSCREKRSPCWGQGDPLRRRTVPGHGYRHAQRLPRPQGLP